MINEMSFDEELTPSAKQTHIPKKLRDEIKRDKLKVFGLIKLSPI